MLRHVEVSIANKEMSSSPLLSLPVVWESCPVTLIRNELDRHESQHMLNEGRGMAALFFCPDSTDLLRFYLLTRIFIPVCKRPVCAQR